MLRALRLFKKRGRVPVGRQGANLHRNRAAAPHRGAHGGRPAIAQRTRRPIRLILERQRRVRDELQPAGERRRHERVVLVGGGRQQRGGYRGWGGAQRGRGGGGRSSVKQWQRHRQAVHIADSHRGHRVENGVRLHSHPQWGGLPSPRCFGRGWVHEQRRKRRGEKIRVGVLKRGGSHGDRPNNRRGGRCRRPHRGQRGPTRRGGGGRGRSRHGAFRPLWVAGETKSVLRHPVHDNRGRGQHHRRLVVILVQVR